MVHVLDSLARRGLVVRVRSQTDRRKQNIRLTGDGVALLAEIKTRALEADRILSDDIAAMKDLIRSGKILEAVEKKIGPLR